MKKINTKLLIIFLFLVIGSGTFATDKYAVASGNWGLTSTWSLTRGGAPGAAVPTATDSVIIPNGFVVNVEASGKNCLAVNVESGGALIASGTNPTSSQIYVRVNGWTIQNDGIIGYNPATPSVLTPIGFETYTLGKTVSLKGSGISKISRVRNGNNVSNTTFAIDQDMTFTYTGSTGTGGAAWYGAQGSGSNNTLWVKAGKTATFVDFGYIATSTNGSVDADGPTTTILVDGNLLLQGANCTMSLRPATGAVVSLIVNGIVEVGRTLKPTGTTGVTSTITVNSGGEFKVGTMGPGVIYFDNRTQTVTGAGKFTLGNGAATLYVRLPGGLNPATGQIQTTGGNTYSTTANYWFMDSTFAQVLGPDFPSACNNLTVTNGTGIDLNQAVIVNGTFSTNTGVTNGGNLTANGTLTLNSGGYFNNPPNYGPASILKYNTGSTYGRYNEWISATGAGCPASVQLSNSTTLNYPNGVAPISFLLTGDLTIDNGSALYMDYGSPGTNNPLRVNGNVNINGSLSLGDALGGDLYVGGNWYLAGAFYPNNRAVYFNGSLQSTITGVTTFPYLFINNVAGVKLVNDISVTNLLTLQNGIVTTEANTLSLGPTGVLSGEQTDRYVLGNLLTLQPVGTGSSTFGGIGVSLAAGADDLGSVTVTRVTGTPITYLSNQSISCKWTLSSATVPVAGRVLSLSWISNFDNGKDLNTAWAFLSTDNGTSWNSASVPQNASVTRTVNLTTTQFGDFTISDGASPFPVELASFTAKQVDNSVVLNWKTTTEINNTGWMIEKYSDNSWKNIGFNKGAGNSSSVKEYTFIDKNISNGINKYRLVQVDKDGKLSYSYSVDVNGNLIITSYNVTNYPNPFNPATTIRFEVPEKSFVSISIYNAIGQKAADLVSETFEKGIYERSFNASGLTSGIYIYKLNAGKFNITKKMILLK